MNKEDIVQKNPPLSNSEKRNLFVNIVIAFLGLISYLTHISDYWKLGIAVFVFGICAIVIFATRDTWKRAIRQYTWLLPLIAGTAGLAAGLVVGVHVHRTVVVMPTPAYIGHIVELANGSGQNTSWLVGSNGERYWIPTTKIFSCLRNEGHTDLGPQSSTVLDGLPESGQWASCPATVNRDSYIGHIVEWANGSGQNASWLVGSNGERYWIPTTKIFSCLRNEGHTDLGPQSSTVLDDLPDLGERASCA